MAKRNDNLKRKNVKVAGQGRKNRNIFILGIILFITILAYSNSLNNKFTDWDDKDYITNNPDIKSLSFHNIKHFFEESTLGMYQPFTDIIYTLEYHFSGLNPFLFHLISLLFHLLNIVLVFYLIQMISKNISISAFVSLFFAIHPMHVESVTWLSEHKDVIYTSFYLTGLIAYVTYLKKDLKFNYLILTFFCFILSLLSKSAAVTLPLMLLLFDFYNNRKISARLIYEKIPFFLLSLAFGIASVITQKAVNHSHEYTIGFNFFDKFLLVCFNIVYYLFNLFFPIKLSAIHPFPVKSGGLLPLKYLFSPLFIALITYLIIKISRYSKDILFCFIFFLIPLLLVIQIIPIGRAVVSERYTYIPYIGLFLFFARSYYLLKENNKKLFDKISRYIIAGGVIYALLFFFMTINQNSKWKDSINLWSNVIDNYPDAAFAYNGRGYAYFSENDDKLRAIMDYSKAIELQENFTDAWFNRATCRLLTQDYKGAISDFDKTIKIDTAYGDAYFNRGYTKCFGLHDNEGALEDYNKANRFIKNDYLLYYNRGSVKFALKDYKGAIDDFTNAIKYKPDYADAWFNRGGTKLLLEDYNGALEDYNMTLRVDHDYKQNSFYYNRGFAKYKGPQDYKGALDDFNIAVNYLKNNYILYFNRGNVKFALKDYKGALIDYKFAQQLNPEYAEIYFNLGNTEYLLGDAKTACKDWKKSGDLGYIDAKSKLNKFCH